MDREKIVKIVLWIIVILGLYFNFFVNPTFGQTSEVIRVDFTHKRPSTVDEKYLSMLKSLGERLTSDQNLDYKVLVSADSVGWLIDQQQFVKVRDSINVDEYYWQYSLKKEFDNEMRRKYSLEDSLVKDYSTYYYNYYRPSKNKKVFRSEEESHIFNASLFWSRAIAVFQAMNMTLETSKVDFFVDQKERYVKVVVFEKDQTIKIINDGVQKNSLRIDVLEKKVSTDSALIQKIARQRNVFFRVGMSGVDFGEDKDFLTLTAKIRWKFNKKTSVLLGAGYLPHPYEDFRDWRIEASIENDLDAEQRWVLNPSIFFAQEIHPTPKDGDLYALQAFGAKLSVGFKFISNGLKGIVSAGFTLAEIDDIRGERKVIPGKCFDIEFEF